MRPVLALVIAVFILGGLELCLTVWTHQPHLGSSSGETAAGGDFAVEVTLTFEAGPDPFALDASRAPSLLVEFRGETIYEGREVIPAGTAVRIEPVTGLVVGKNAFYVRATPRDDDPTLERALRVRLMQNGQVVASESMWSAAGAPVEGVIEVEIDGKPADGPPRD